MGTVLCCIGLLSSIPDFFPLNASRSPTPYPVTIRNDWVKGSQRDCMQNTGLVVPGHRGVRSQASPLLTLGQLELTGQHQDVTASLHPSYRSQSKFLRRTHKEPHRFLTYPGTQRSTRSTKPRKKWPFHSRSLKGKILPQNLLGQESPRIWIPIGWVWGEENRGSLWNCNTRTSIPGDF